MEDKKQYVIMEQKHGQEPFAIKSDIRFWNMDKGWMPVLLSSTFFVGNIQAWEIAHDLKVKSPDHFAVAVAAENVPPWY